MKSRRVQTPGYSQRFVFISLIGVVLLALSVSFIFVIQNTRQQQVDQALDGMLNKARLVTIAHEQWVAGSRNLLSMVVVALERLPNLERDCATLLTEFNAATHGVDSIVLASPDGSLFCAPRPESAAVNFADREYFRRVLAGTEFAVGRHVIGRVGGQPVLPVAMPLHGPEGNIRYVAILGRQLTWVEGMLAQQHLSPDTSMLVVDSDGVVLARAPRAAQGLAPGLLERISAMHEGVLAVPETGEEGYFLGFTPLGPETGDTYVVVQTPVADVLEPVRMFLTGVLTQYATAAVLIFVVLWFGLGHWVLRPLRQMLRTVEQVRQGDLSSRVGVERGTVEMVRLAQSFDGMLDRLQEIDGRLRRQSEIDGLLGIANRRAWDNALRHEWARALRESMPLSLLMLDVDDFKAYNDSYGHQAGDACLQQIAQAIAATLKRPGDFVARYGGEEFAVLLPATDAAGAEEVARAIQQAVARLAIPHNASRAGTEVTVSIGIASVAPHVAVTPDDLLRSADQALYSAKQDGRNRYVHHNPP